MSITVGLQSFMNAAPAPAPLPSYTAVEIVDIPSGMYAVYINVAGPWYEDNTYTVYCANVTEYSPGDPHTFALDKKYYYSAVSDHTSVTVYFKETSNDNWVNAGSINTDDSRVTKTTSGTFLIKMTIDWDHLPNP